MAGSPAGEKGRARRRFCQKWHEAVVCEQPLRIEIHARVRHRCSKRIRIALCAGGCKGADSRWQAGEAVLCLCDVKERPSGKDTKSSGCIIRAAPIREEVCVILDKVDCPARINHLQC